jgi:hypothetical protein
MIKKFEKTESDAADSAEGIALLPGKECLTLKNVESKTTF